MSEKLVSDEEVRAAKVLVDKVAEFAGHKPIPDFIVRFILEEAAMVRMGMKPMPQRDPKAYRMDGTQNWQA